VVWFGLACFLRSQTDQKGSRSPSAPEAQSVLSFFPVYGILDALLASTNPVSGESFPNDTLAEDSFFPDFLLLPYRF